LLSLKDGFSDGRAVKSREGPSEGTLVGDPLGMIDDGKQVYGRDKGPLSYRQQKKLINKTTKRLYLVIRTHINHPPDRVTELIREFFTNI
jgi:hypothetical protein